MLNEIACPHCGQQELAAQEPTGLVVCTRCGLKYANDDPIACPKCEAINSKTASYCSTCGEALKQKCQNCGAENWAGAYTCVSCKQSLNSVEAIAQRHSQGYRGTLEEQRRGANALKAQEAVASRKRMAGLMDTENKRQAQLAQQMAEQKAQQTRLLLAAAIVLVIFVVAAVFFVVATAR
jgi:hypothetical protein